MLSFNVICMSLIIDITLIVSIIKTSSLIVDTSSLANRANLTTKTELMIIVDVIHRRTKFIYDRNVKRIKILRDSQTKEVSLREFLRNNIQDINQDNNVI